MGPGSLLPIVFAGLTALAAPVASSTAPVDPAGSTACDAERLAQFSKAEQDHDFWVVRPGMDPESHPVYITDPDRPATQEEIDVYVDARRQSALRLYRRIRAETISCVFPSDEPDSSIQAWDMLQLYRHGTHLDAMAGLRLMMLVGRDECLGLAEELIRRYPGDLVGGRWISGSHEKGDARMASVARLAAIQRCLYKDKRKPPAVVARYCRELVEPEREETEQGRHAVHALMYLKTYWKRLGRSDEVGKVDLELRRQRSAREGAAR